MTKKNNLFKNISIMFCLVPMLILSLFCFVPTLKNSKDFNVYAADETITSYTFTGAEFITPITWTKNSIEYYYTSLSSVNCSFSYANGVYSAGVSGRIMRSSGTEYIYYSQSFNDLSLEKTSKMYIYVSETSCLEVRLYRSGNITNKINRVVFTCEESLDYLNKVYYYDENNNYICFVFVVWICPSTDVYKPFLFEDKSYHFNLDFSDNEYYDAGYTDGYLQGNSDGNSKGYEDGYKAGEIVGYGNGYNVGLEYGTDYSFNGLIGAVIDAPVSAFTSLLNFELFGVNILGLVTGLLSLAVIVLIIKLCMGGR